jgi:hypothetical protein
MRNGVAACSRSHGSHRSCLVKSEYGLQVYPEEKAEADCAQQQPDPTHHVGDERQEINTVRTGSAVAVIGTIFEAGHAPPP